MSLADQTVTIAALAANPRSAPVKIIEAETILPHFGRGTVTYLPFRVHQYATSAEPTGHFPELRLKSAWQMLCCHTS